MTTPESFRSRAGARGPWGPWATAGLALVIGIGFIVAGSIAAIPYFLLVPGQDPGGEAAAALERNGLFTSLSEIFGGVAAVALIVLFVRMRKGPAPAAYLGLHPVPRATVLRWLMLTVLVAVWFEVVNRVGGHESVDAWSIEIWRTAGFLPLLLVALLIVAPVFEELLFRGFLFEGLRGSRLGGWGAVTVVALAWALVHRQYDAWFVVQIFCFGLLLGAARLRTGSTALAIAMHSLFSALAMAQLAVEAG